MGILFFRKHILAAICIIMLCFLCVGCNAQTVSQTPVTLPAENIPEEPPEEPPPLPEHSELYIPEITPEDVVLYFQEVCLQAEITNSGDPTKLQKWTQPLYYTCIGNYTETDKAVLVAFADWLNTIAGFPGMEETQDPDLVNLNIYFYDYWDYMSLMGENFQNTDGGITFWYNDANEIYTAIIGYRTDIPQELRNSVILEEIYNGLGPVNDTELRQDSVIYSGFSQPQQLSQMDELILKLLYHPQLQCGMDASACEEIIRQLYY